MESLEKIDGKLREHWYILALSEEVKQKPLRRPLYEKFYVLFRDSSGCVRVLLDRCPHRGTKLSEGLIEGDQIRCPYHGWAFSGSGQLLDVPSDGPLEKAPKRDWCVEAPIVVEQDAAIWIWCGNEKPIVKSPPWRFPYASDPQWTSYFMTTDFENEVTHLAQNFMDVPHTVFVHSKWFRDKAQLKVPYHLLVANGRVKATYEKPNDSIGGILRPVINPKNLPMEHNDEFIFPNLTRVDYRFGEHGFIINSQCSPLGRFRTRVYTWIAYRGNWLAPLLKPVMQFYTRQVIQQDVVIMANQGRNLQNFQERQDFKSTAADEIHLAISRLRELGISSTSAAYEPNFSKERVFWI